MGALLLFEGSRLARALKFTEDDESNYCIELFLETRENCGELVNACVQNYYYFDCFMMHHSLR